MHKYKLTNSLKSVCININTYSICKHTYIHTYINTNTHKQIYNPLQQICWYYLQWNSRIISSFASYDMGWIVKIMDEIFKADVCYKFESHWKCFLCLASKLYKYIVWVCVCVCMWNRKDVCEQQSVNLYM